jgi:hypothetical protein
VRALIRRFDAFLAQQYGLFNFTDEPDCLLRLQAAGAPHRLNFPGQVVQPGEPVLLIHLWSEHIPRTLPAGPDLAWAKTIQRAFLKSLQAVGSYIQEEPRLADIRAIGGVTILMFAGNRRNGARFMERLGFTVMPYTNPLGRFGEFWENFYTWMLIWTYNPASLRSRKLFQMRRSEIWIPAEKFVARYGGKPAKHQFLPHTTSD